jgi:hypothetical protein
VSPALQHGPYPTPLIVTGCRLVCGVRGVVRIVGLTTAPIPWPVGERDGERDLVVYRGLARALRSESAGAIATAWGVAVATVERWQKAIENSEDAPLSVHISPIKAVWTPADDAVVLRTPDAAKAAALLGRTVGAVKFRLILLREKRAKAADRMRKPPRKKRRQ